MWRLKWSVSNAYKTDNLFAGRRKYLFSLKLNCKFVKRMRPQRAWTEQGKFQLTFVRASLRKWVLRAQYNQMTKNRKLWKCQAYPDFIWENEIKDCRKFVHFIHSILQLYSDKSHLQAATSSASSLTTSIILFG